MTPKKREFYGGFTLESLAVLLAPLLVAAYLIWYGVQNDPLFPPQADMQSRIIFYYAPIVFGGLIILVTIGAFASYMIVKVTITPDLFHFKHGAREFSCKWRNLTYVPPKPNKKHFRIMTIGSGKQVGHIYSMFFPKFDLLARVIEVAKKEATGYDIEV